MEGPNDYQVAILITVGTLAMLFIAVGIILFIVFYQKRMIQEQLERQQLELDHQKKVLEATIENQENERGRIAADLHDSIGAMLSAIRVSLITLTRKEIVDASSISESKRMLDDTIQSVRRISRDLMPATLEKFGLAQAVKELCDRFQATSSMPIRFEMAGELHAIDKRRELMIFRIIQELINNSLKHANASEIVVTFNSTNHLTISVEDDGIGFWSNMNDQNEKGLGLYSVENRARIAGATVEYDHERKIGSKILVIVPYEKV